MRKALHILMALLWFGSLSANEDSLIVYSLLEQAKQNQNVDSANYYADKAMSFAKKQNYFDGILTTAKYMGNQYAATGELEKSVTLYKDIVNQHSFDPKQLSTAYNQIGIYHVYMGHYDSTEAYFLKALKMREQLKDSVGMGASLNNLGNVTMTTGDYDKALNYFVKALTIRETINDSGGIASSTNNLGLIYYKQQKFDKAIEYYHRALAINQQQGLPDKEILILMNLGNIYDEINQLDSSVHYYQLAIPKAEQYGDVRLIAMTYGNMGVTQQKLENYGLAKSYLHRALKIRIQSEDLEGQAILYNNLGAVYNGTLQYDSAIYYFNKSLNFSEQINFKEATRDNYMGLVVAYESIGKYQEALQAHQQYANIKDSLLNEETNQQIAQINAKYETEKKEKQLAEQKIKISNQQLKVKQRNYLLMGLILVLVFIVATSYYIYKQQKLKQQRLEEENRLKDKIAEVTVQNQLHEERLRISGDLHDNIGAQLTFIISSIDNMKLAFTSVDEKLNSKLTDVANFTRTTITQLRDTIWALNKDEISFDDLKARLYNYIENAKLAQEQTEFEFKTDLTSNFLLNSIQGVSIYRVVQEAINNSIKYAAATNIVLNITETNTTLSLSIKDDGIGFNLPEIQLGNGLENMKNRAASIHALFTLNSAPDKGTEIIMQVDKKYLL